MNQHIAVRINRAGTQFTLLEDVDYNPLGIPWVARAGTVTDFATIPKIFWWVWNPCGSTKVAAIIHDGLYDLHHSGLSEMTRYECDRIFLRVLRATGNSILTWLPFYLAVRWFGWVYWNGHGRR